MSDFKKDLWLYYALDETSSSDNKIIDKSEGNFNHGTVVGTLAFNENPLLGRVAAFSDKEHFISIPTLDFSDDTEITLALWYKAGYLKESDNTVLLFSNEEKTNFIQLHSSFSEEIQLSIKVENEEAITCIVRENPSERLKHLAIVLGNKGVKIYLNGVLSAENSNSFRLSCYKEAKIGNLASNIPCEIAQFSIFKNALSDTEIETIYKDDLRAGSELSKNTLLVHLPLDEVRNGSIKDVSGMALTSSTGGAPKVVYDEEVGSALSFDGKRDFVKIPQVMGDTQEGLTLEMWCNVAAPSMTDSQTAEIVLVSFFSETQKLEVRLNHSLNVFEIYYGNVFLQMHSKYYTFGKWIHFALSIDYKNKTLTPYLDGVLAELHNLKDESDFIKGDFNINLGADSKGKSNFKGQLNNFRLYKKVLTREEIQQDILKDQTANASFRNVYPIEFKIETEKDNSSFPILYIEQEGKGNPLQVEMINTSGTEIKFEPIESLHEDSYHLQLRFRKNVLSEKVLQQLSENENKKIGSDWEYSIGNNIGKREDWISFKRIGSTILPKNDLCRFEIPNVSASAMSGARNTSVEIKFSNLRYSDAPDFNLSGFLSRHFDIISHIGLRNSPFVAAVEGSNTILNDGVTENEITLYIATANPQKEVKFSTLVGKKSKFILRFQDKEAALPKTFKAQEQDNRFDSISPTEGENTWNFEYQDNEEIPLGKDNPIRLKISNWLTEHLSGITNLYLDYQNIPGYWDGTLVIPIDMGQIIERDKKVGIGIANPQAKLHIADQDKKGDILNINDYLVISKEGKVGVGILVPEANLDIAGSVKINKDLSVTESLQVKKIKGEGGVTIEGGLSVTESLQVKKIKGDGGVTIEGGLNVTNTLLTNSIESDGKLLISNSGGLTLHRKTKPEPNGYKYITIQYKDHDTITEAASIESDGGSGVGFYARNGRMHLSSPQHDVVISTHKTILLLGNVLANERVGIGTDTPQCPLEIRGYAFMDNGSFKHYAKEIGNANGTVDTSIKASNRIVGSEFNATSDARVKNIISRLTPDEALEKINKLQAVQYTYKDTVTSGNREKIGFIAQEFETTLPSAVHQSTDIVPSVMCMSEKLHFDATHSLLTVTLPKPHPFAQNTVVKFLTETNEIKSAVNVIDNFTISFPFNGNPLIESLFVYGEEVNDFRHLDHDQIHALSVTAIQQLLKENTSIRQQLQALEQRLTRLELTME